MQIPSKSSLLKPVAVCAALTLSGPPAFAVDTGSGSSSASGGSGSADLLALARAEIDGGDYEEAIRRLRVYVSENSRSADAYNLLGFASRNLGNLKDAARYYKSALRLDPKHLGALEYQGELFLKTSQIDEARKNLAKLLRLCGPDCHEYLDLRADIQKAVGS